jgi:hypothetical protein
MSYWLDGKMLDYETCFRAVVDLLEAGEDVSYSWSMGIDLYWYEEEHPWWAHPVTLEDTGIYCQGRLVEPLYE